MSWLNFIAPDSFFPRDSPVPSYSPTSSGVDRFTCTICMRVLDRPLELGCGSLVCGVLLQVGWGQLHFVMSLLPWPWYGRRTHPDPQQRDDEYTCGLLVNCTRGCNRTIRADQYICHLESWCQGHFKVFAHSPSNTTISDTLNKTTDTPVMPAEKRATESLPKRRMAESMEKVVEVLPTHGQASLYSRRPVSLIYYWLLYYSWLKYRGADTRYQFLQSIKTRGADFWDRALVILCGIKCLP